MIEILLLRSRFTASPAILAIVKLHTFCGVHVRLCQFAIVPSKQYTINFLMALDKNSMHASYFVWCALPVESAESFVHNESYTWRQIVGDRTSIKKKTGKTKAQKQKNLNCPNVAMYSVYTYAHSIPWGNPYFRKHSIQHNVPENSEREEKNKNHRAKKQIQTHYTHSDRWLLLCCVFTAVPLRNGENRNEEWSKRRKKSKNEKRKKMTTTQIFLRSVFLRFERRIVLAPPDGEEGRSRARARSWNEIKKK